MLAEVRQPTLPGIIPDMERKCEVVSCARLGEKHYRKGRRALCTEHRKGRPGPPTVRKQPDSACVQCGESDKRLLDIDHITPRALGGSNKQENLQTLCVTCHRLKTVAERDCWPS